MHNLAQIFEGWEGYQTSLVHAVAPLSAGQLAMRPAPHCRSTGELIRHIALGRITWLARIQSVGLDPIADCVPRWFTDGDGSRHVDEQAISPDRADILVEWLASSWQPIQQSLAAWTMEDLFKTYPHRFRGIDYVLSCQWVLWRIMSHDIHHGGQLALILSMNGIEASELRALGGHITEPPLADPA